MAQWWTRLRAASRHTDDGFDCWAIRSVEEAPECGETITRELTDQVIPVFDAWLAHYAELDKALAEGRDEDLPELFAARPSDLLKGVDHFRRADHRYAEWIGSTRF